MKLLLNISIFNLFIMCLKSMNSISNSEIFRNFIPNESSSALIRQSIARSPIQCMAQCLKTLNCSLVEINGPTCNLYKSLKLSDKLTSNKYYRIPKEKSECIGKTVILDMNGKKIPISQFDIKVNLKSNSISSVDPFTFECFNQTQELDLSRNKINRLKSDSLFDLVELTRLGLAFNEIESIDSDVFIHVPKLKILDLGVNFIKRIEAIAFKPIQLEELYIARNSISSLDDLGVEYLKSLRILHSENNGLKLNSSDSFQFMKNLTRIQLSSNKIKFLYANTFKGLENLNIVTLHSNGMIDLDIDSFDGLLTLQFADISNNNLNMTTIDDLKYRYSNINFNA